MYYQSSVWLLRLPPPAESPQRALAPSHAHISTHTHILQLTFHVFCIYKSVSVGNLTPTL